MDRDATFQWLCGHEFTRLWTAARSRLERNGLSVAGTPLDLKGLSLAEIEAISGLVGKRMPTGDRIRVKLGDLDTVLRSSPCRCGLVEMLGMIGEPVVDRSTMKAAERAESELMWRRGSVHPLLGIHPEFEEWLTQLRQRGTLTRLEVPDRADLLVSALDVCQFVLEDLPNHRSWLGHLPALAARLTGSAHGLDAHEPLGQLVESAVLFLTDAQTTRHAWRWFGIELDAVNSSVLTLNIGSRPDGVPTRMTNMDLDRFKPAVTGANEVVIVENPTVLAAAARTIGSESKPMVALEGQPGLVAQRLLRSMAASNWRLGVHADFDASGLLIAAFAMRSFGAEPWQFTTDHYVAAATTAPSIPWAGAIPDAHWDPRLRKAIGEHRRTIHEEALLLKLLGELYR